MRIDIVGDESIDRQTRIYAEYRLFAAVARALDLRRFSRALLVLRRARGPAARERTMCVVAVERNDGVVTRFTAAGGHPYEAVNRAVERVRRASWPRSSGHAGSQAPPNEAMNAVE